jgi:hypothetical protein
MLRRIAKLVFVLGGCPLKSPLELISVQRKTGQKSDVSKSRLSEKNQLTG